MHPFTAKLTVFKILLCVKKLQRILLQHYVENLDETKNSIVQSFRSKDFKLADLENGLRDDWCVAKGLPL